MAHGGISKSNSPDFGALPAETDDEQMDNPAYHMERSQTPEPPSWTSLFVQMLKLSDKVLRPIQEYFLDSPPDADDDSISDILATALRIDDGLQEWHGALPRHLRVDSICSQDQTGLRRQALLLHMRHLETKSLLSRVTIMKLVRKHPGQPLVGMSRALVGGVVDACCTSSVELMDLMARERELLVLSGTPQSSMVICKSTTTLLAQCFTSELLTDWTALCVIGMTLSMLLKMPVLSALVRNPAICADDTRRCLSLAKRFYTRHEAQAERYMGVFEAAVNQPQGRQSMSSGMVVDPALEGKVLPVLHGNSDAAKEVGGREMGMLEGWYLGAPEVVEGLSICELLSLW